jgi:site-specific recombinase XerD
MGITRQLQKSIDIKLFHNRDGSYETQRARKNRLHQISHDLVDGGYKLRHISGFRTKHIIYLVNHWKEQNLSAGTMKNRMTDIRWLCEKLNKAHIVSSNKELGIDNRIYVTNDDKSIKVTNEQIDNIKSPYIKLSLQLQELFGLRREESMKFKPFVADKGDKLELQSSWCKGGKARSIPIGTKEQRDLIDKIKIFLEQAHLSLIPEDKTYKTHKKLYEKQLIRAGIHKAHGLRHRYAQKLYLEKTGWECPARGGPLKKELSGVQKEIDLKTRLEISKVLGHERISITDVYL